MNDKDKNIYPIFDQMLSRQHKEQLLNQCGTVIWMTGLSGSGKSTIGKGLEKKLFDEGVLTTLLDGDNVRTGINNNLGFSLEDREENIRRIAETAKLFLESAIVTICCFVSPLKSIRDRAREIIGDENFIEVYINTPLDICEERDVKGLYQKARSGNLANFTGVDSPFEAPDSPYVEIKTLNRTVEESVEELYQAVMNKIKLV